MTDPDHSAAMEPAPFDLSLPSLIAAAKREGYLLGLEAAAALADSRAGICHAAADAHRAKGDAEMSITERCAGIEAKHIALKIRALANENPHA